MPLICSWHVNIDSSILFLKWLPKHTTQLIIQQMKNKTKNNVHTIFNYDKNQRFYCEYDKMKNKFKCYFEYGLLN